MNAPPPQRAAAEVVNEAGADAPWLVMVHGNSQDRRAFGAVAPAYREAFRLLIVDLPGHGASRDIPGPYGPAEHARAVGAAMDAAIEPAGADRTGADRTNGPGTHFWGTHTGASVALLLACEPGRRFASLVLEGPVIPGDNPPSVVEALSIARATAAARGVAAAREEWFERSEWFRVMRENPAVCRAAEHRAMIEDFGGAPWVDPALPAPITLDDTRLAAIDTPVLIVNGEHDLPEFLEVADRLARVLPTARIARVPGGGGFPLWEYPEPVNRIVAPFLREADARP